MQTLHSEIYITNERQLSSDNIAKHLPSADQNNKLKLTEALIKDDCSDDDSIDGRTRVKKKINSLLGLGLELVR